MTEMSGYRTSPQQAAGWKAQAGAAGHPYWATLTVHLDGPCDMRDLQSRFDALLQSEEIFRTRLRSMPGLALPLQLIGESADSVLLVGDAEDPADASRTLVAHLRQLGDQRVELVLRAPATHADSASLRLVAEHLTSNRCSGERLQYADYAEWKNGLLDDQEAAGVRYWQQQLADPVPTLALRLAGETGQAFRPQSMSLPDIAAAPLARQCREHDCTAEEWLLAAWMLLLSRLAGQAQVEVGCADAGRGDALDTALGPYELAIPVRAQLDHALPMAKQIAAVRHARSAAIGWRDFCAGAAPDVGFRWREAPAWRGAAIVEESCVAQPFSLRLSCAASAERIACMLDYDAARWDGGSLQTLAEQWALLCAGLLAPGEGAAGAISLLGPVQRSLIASGQEQPRIEQASVVELIERQAAARPQAIALADSGATLSYAALNQRANRLAHHLIGSGVAPGDVVGIHLPRCNDMLVSILAVLKAGAAYLALDPSYPAARLEFMVRDSGARQIIGREGAPVTIVLDGADIGDALPDANPGLARHLDLPAYLIYTSGSSGQPKPVEVSHRSLSQSTQVRMAWYGAPVRAFLLLSSFSFDSSVAGIFWTLAQGGTLVLPAPGEELALDRLCELIEKHAVSHSLSLPSLYAALLEHAGPGRLGRLDTWIVAGETCPDAVVERHHALVPHARLVNEYGPTEGGVWASADVLERGRAVTIGRPVPGMLLELVNEHGALSGLGESGEICLAGAQLASGYRGHPELTAARFTGSAGIAGGQRAYRTGDLASRDAAGRLHFLGRRDHQVKIRGYRVELGEIERQLLLHDAVGEAAVIAQEHGGGQRLLAYFTGRQDSAPDAGALRTWLSERLPGYMVPAQLIGLRAMPLTPNGKRDLNALPAPQSVGEGECFIAPRNALEQELADICAGVLRLPRFGATDNFFQLGGDSILSLQVVTRANRSGIALTTRQVFEHQTVAAMAAVAEWRQAESFAADLGWLQSWTDAGLLGAFALAADRYRIDAGEVLAAALARTLLAEQPGASLRMLRLHDSGNGRYVTRHDFGPGSLAWEDFAPQAKAALRREADSVGRVDTCLSVRESDTTLFETGAATSQAPLQLAATLLPHALTLQWSADSAHYTEERLQQLSVALAQCLLDLSQFCSASSAAGLQAQDFPAAGLDQDALAELLAELNADDAS